jgi:fumarate reductase flavoprotein subunit
VLWTGTAVPGEKKPFTADRHKENKVTCQGCHGVDKPETPATEKACLACHKSLEGVAGRTENRQPNPHKNHLTESSDIECMHCHRGHKADALICHQCHTGLEFEKQGAETKQSIPAE